jgi:hypothetical protein
MGREKGGERMREIILTNGNKVLVDDEDYEKLSKLTWYFRKQGYAVGNLPSPENGVYPKVLMHRYILNAPKGTQVDHINGNKLDNRRCNLRIANASKNKANCGIRSNNTSGYKGVTKATGRRKNKPWTAQIKVNYKRIHLGYFETKESAALAYNEAALKYFGEFAKLNEL